MIRLHRTTEYGLMALQLMSKKNKEQLTSAREVADAFGLPFEITAKTLLKLRDTGIIQSAHGARGGYSLARALNEITLDRFLSMMEGPQNLVACAGESLDTSVGDVSHCEYHGKCEIRGPLSSLQARVSDFLNSIKLSELVDSFSTGLTSTSGSVGDPGVLIAQSYSGGEP